MCVGHFLIEPRIGGLVAAVDVLQVFGRRHHPRVVDGLADGLLRTVRLPGPQVALGEPPVHHRRATGGGAHPLTVNRVERRERVAEDEQPVGPPVEPLGVQPPVGPDARDEDVGRGLRRADELRQERIGKRSRTGEEILATGRQLASAGAGEGHHPAVVLLREEHTEAAGLACPVVGGHVDRGKPARRAGGRRELPGGVRDSRVDDVHLDGREAEFGQPALQPRAPSSGVDHEIRRERLPHPAVEAADLDAGDPRTVADQRDGLRPLPHRDPAVGQDLVTDHPVQQRAAAHDGVLPRREAVLPPVRGQRHHVLLEADPARARGQHAVDRAGQQAFHDPGAARPQHMDMACLRQAPAVRGAVGEGVALHHGDGTHMTGQHVSRQHAGPARAEHDSVSEWSGHRCVPSPRKQDVPASGTAWCQGARSSGWLARASPLTAGHLPAAGRHGGPGPRR